MSSQKNLPSIDAVLKQSWLIFRKTLRYSFSLNLLLTVFSLLPILFISELQNPPTPEVFQQGLQILMPYLPFYIGGLVLGNAAIFYRMGYLMQNKLPSLGEVFGFVLKKLLPLFVATILFGFAVGIGFMALFVPGIIFAVYLMFYQPLILFSNVTVLESLEISHRLVKEKWWYSATIIGIATSLIPFCSLLLGGIFNLLGIDISFEGTLVVEIFLNSLLASFFHCTLLVLYQELRNFHQFKVSDSFVA